VPRLLIVLGLGALCLASAAPGAPAPKDVPADLPGPQRRAMVKSLTDAIGDSFTFVEGRLVWDRHGRPTWLATLRAREPGLFLLHCRADYDFPPSKKGPLPWTGVTWIYQIAIGKKGEARVVEPNGYAGAYPLACVGDEVVVPVRVGPIDKKHSFQLTRGTPDKESFGILAETATRGWAAQAKEGMFPLRNGAADVLKLVTTTSSSIRTRSGRTTRHSLGAVFDAVKGGKFVLEVRLDRPAPAAGQPNNWQTGPEEWAFDAVPRGRPLRVTVPRWDVHKTGGKSSSHSSETARAGVVVLRVGDRVLLPCGGYVTPGLGAVAHPPVEARKVERALIESPWRTAAPK
jgi:hypothetical protein